MIWVYMIIFVMFIKIIPHYLFYKGTKKVPASDAGIILLLEPLVGAILAYLFLNEIITIYTLGGGILIIIANYLVIKHSTKIKSV